MLEGKTFEGDIRQWPAVCGEWGFPLCGGGKTWIAPESDWPACAPHRDLDSLPWQVLDTWCDAHSMGIEVRSPVCSVSGLQLTRRLTLPAQTTVCATQEARRCAAASGTYSRCCARRAFTYPYRHTHKRRRAGRPAR